MRTDRQIMALHAAISIRNWHAVEVAANALRDHDELEASLAAAEARAEKAESELAMSEQRFATLRAAYDKERQRPIQIYGSAKEPTDG